MLKIWDEPPQGGENCYDESDGSPQGDDGGGAAAAEMVQRIMDEKNYVEELNRHNKVFIFT